MGGQHWAENLFCLQGFHTSSIFLTDLCPTTVVVWTQVILDKAASQMHKIIFSTLQALFYKCVTGNKMNSAMLEANSLFK